MRHAIAALVLLGALAALAAGCGSGGAPHAFTACPGSGTRDLATSVSPTTFDCLAHAYRHRCAPTTVRVAESGIDTGTDYRLRMYPRGDECVGEVSGTFSMMGTTRSTHHDDCGSVLLVGGRSLVFSRCGDTGMVTLGRGKVCRVMRRTPACTRAIAHRAMPAGCLVAYPRLGC